MIIKCFFYIINEGGKDMDKKIVFFDIDGTLVNVPHGADASYSKDKRCINRI